jgi:hypothetical protein
VTRGAIIVGEKSPWHSLTDRASPGFRVKTCNGLFSTVDCCSFAYSALACFRMGDVGVGVFPEHEEIS